MNTQAEIAREYSHNLGAPDYTLADALDPAYVEAEREAEEDRLEREGRREMYATLFDGFND